MLELTPFYEALFPPVEKSVVEMADEDLPLAEVVFKRRLSLSAVGTPTDDENDLSNSNIDNCDLVKEDSFGANDVKRLKLDNELQNNHHTTTTPPLSTTTHQSLTSSLTVTKTLSVNYVDQNNVCSATLSHSIEHVSYTHHSRTQQEQEQEQQQQQQQNSKHSSAISNCEQTSIQFSPSSYSSSDSLSDDDEGAEDDDDDDDDDDSEDDDDDDDEDDIIDIDLEEVELAHENSFNSSGMASTESESGYDERSSSEGSNESESFELGSILLSGTTFTASLSDDQSQQHHSQHQSHVQHNVQQQQLQQSQHLQQQQQQQQANGFSISMPVDSNSSVFCSYTPPTAYYVGSSIHAHSHHQGSLNGQMSPLARPGSHLHSQIPPPQPSESQKVLQKKQTIFSICLQKLQRYRQCSDSSLVKSVLVCNTLRSLERDFKKAGVELNFGPNGVQFNSSPVIDSPVADLDILPSTPVNSAPSMQQSQTQHSQQIPPTCTSFTCPTAGTPLCSSPKMPTVTEDSSLHCSPNSDTNNNCKPSALTVPEIQSTNSESTVNNNHSNDQTDFHSQTSGLCNAFSGWPEPEEEARLDSLNWATDFGPSRLSSTVDVSINSIDMISPSYSSPIDNDSSSPSDQSVTVTGTFATLLPSGQANTTTDVVSVSGNLLESTSYAFSGTNSNTNTVTSTISSSASFLSYTTTTGSDEIFSDIDMSLYDFDLFGNTLGSSLSSTATATKTVSSSNGSIVTPTVSIDDSTTTISTLQVTPDASDSKTTSTSKKVNTETFLGVTPCV